MTSPPDLTLEEQLIALLHYNPWSTAEFAAGLLGRSTAAVRRAFKNGAVFESLKAPVSPRVSPRRWLQVYCPQASEQIKHLGYVRRPELLAAALLMGYDRLGRARRVISHLQRLGLLVWAISPWRPKRSNAFLDALVLVRTRHGEGTLIGLAAPPKVAATDWLYGLVAEWRTWRRSSLGLPASLVFWRPHISPGVARIAAREVPALNGHAAIFIGEDLGTQSEAGWIYLQATAGLRRVGTAPWEHGPSAPLALFQKEVLVNERRRTAYPHAMGLRDWSRRDSSLSAQGVRFYLAAAPRCIDLLGALGRYAGLTSAAYRRLRSEVGAPRRFRSRLRSLLAQGQAKWVGSPRRCQLTSLGVHTLALMAGVEAKAMARYLGWPASPTLLGQQRGHTQRVVSFMTALLEEGCLLSWDMLAARQYFFEVWAGGPQAIKRMTIHVDSLGYLRLAKPHVAQPFWLEVDRGTRFGRSLSTKLKKYFLAYLAGYREWSIPPLLYVVDCGGVGDEGRLRAVQGRLLQLAAQFPGSPLRVALTTATLLDRPGPALTKKRIWRVVTQGSAQSDLVALPEALLGSQALGGGSQPKAKIQNGGQHDFFKGRIARHLGGSGWSG